MGGGGDKTMLSSYSICSIYTICGNSIQNLMIDIIMTIKKFVNI